MKLQHVGVHHIKKATIMARKTRKAEQLKQEIVNSVPIEQREIITQPITFTYLNGEMTMLQTRIQTMIMEKLQERIASALQKRAKGGFTGELFTDADFAPLPNGHTKYLTFEVKYSELGVEPSHYEDIDKAALAMQSIIHSKELTDEHGKKYVEYTVVFDKVTIPVKTKGRVERRDSIKLRMLPETAHDLFNIIPYHRYLKDAVFLFRSGYSGRIYLLINANKRLGTWKISYQKLRKILLASYDNDTKQLSVEKYPEVYDFKRRVLDVAKKEIDKAADRVDCTFDYELEYPHGKRCGTPENIVFRIHMTDLGKSIMQKKLDCKPADAVEIKEETKPIKQPTDKSLNEW